MSAVPADARAARPLREGLIQFSPPRLLGSRCPDCHTIVFPAKDFCPKCHSESDQATVVLSEHGTVFSYTVVHQAPAGRRTPYVLAYVDLEDGVRVMAQIDHPPANVRLGMPVKVDIRQVSQDAEGPIVGYVFVAEQTAKEHA
jgi:uncharacterized protein